MESDNKLETYANALARSINYFNIDRPDLSATHLGGNMVEVKFNKDVWKIKTTGNGFSASKNRRSENFYAMTCDLYDAIGFTSCNRSCPLCISTLSGRNG
jgi:hypothetical protein